MLTQQRLKELFDYNPEAGTFLWKEQTKTGTSAVGPRNRWAGQVAGVVNSHGYNVIIADGKLYRACRLAWLYMTGEWPVEHIDHVDGAPSNDKWTNLRECARSQNMCNTKLRADNTSGVRGVSWNKRKGAWHVRVNVEGQLYHCGYFDDFETAKRVRDMQALRLHGDFARTHSLEITP